MPVISTRPRPSFPVVALLRIILLTRHAAPVGAIETVIRPSHHVHTHEYGRYADPPPRFSLPPRPSFPASLATLSAVHTFRPLRLATSIPTSSMMSSLPQRSLHPAPCRIINRILLVEGSEEKGTARGDESRTDLAQRILPVHSAYTCARTHAHTPSCGLLRARCMQPTTMGVLEQSHHLQRLHDLCFPLHGEGICATTTKE